MLKIVGALLAALLLPAPLAVAQILSHSQIAFGASEDYSHKSAGTSGGLAVTQSPTRATGYWGTYRYSLSSRSAVELNYGYLKNTQNYTLTDSTGFQTAFGINSTVHEATAAYVLSLRKIYRFIPFAQLGGGALIFIPTGNTSQSTGVGAETQTKSTLLYGLGTDFRLTAGFALRLQYRGLVYKAPNFSLPTYSTGAFGHIAEPGVGLVYNF